jgi:hypothetical protein
MKRKRYRVPMTEERKAWLRRRGQEMVLTRMVAHGQVTKALAYSLTTGLPMPALPGAGGGNAGGGAKNHDQSTLAGENPQCLVTTAAGSDSSTATTMSGAILAGPSVVERYGYKEGKVWKPWEVRTALEKVTEAGGGVAAGPIKVPVKVEVVASVQMTVSAAPWPKEAYAVIYAACLNPRLIAVKVGDRMCSMYKGNRWWKIGQEVRVKLVKEGGSPTYAPVNP